MIRQGESDHAIKTKRFRTWLTPTHGVRIFWAVRESALLEPEGSSVPNPGTNQCPKYSNRFSISKILARWSPKSTISARPSNIWRGWRRHWTRYFPKQDSKQLPKKYISGRRLLLTTRSRRSQVFRACQTKNLIFFTSAEWSTPWHILTSTFWPFFWTSVVQVTRFMTITALPPANRCGEASRAFFCKALPSNEKNPWIMLPTRRVPPAALYFSVAK